MNRFQNKHIQTLLTAILWFAAEHVSAAPDANDSYGQVAGYQIAQPRAALMAIEAEIRAASPEQLRTIEGRLLAILQSPAATKDAKNWICRQLRQIGSERSVAAVMPLLSDADTATAARWALQSIPGAKVDQALRTSLDKLSGGLKAGVIQTIGSRKDVAAVPVLAPLASDADAAIAEAALGALGQIGGPEALAAVRGAKVPASLRQYRLHAILACADSIAAAGKRQDAAAVYQALFQEAAELPIRIAALRGLLATDHAKADGPLRASLKSEQTRLRLAAARFLDELGENQLQTSVLADLPALPADVQTAILARLRAPSALPSVLKAVKSDDESVRLAAIETLGRLGDATSVALLLGVAAGQGDSAAMAQKSLQALRGADIDRALLAAAAKGLPASRAAAIRAAAARGVGGAEPILLEAAKDADESVRKEAFTALGVLAEPKALPALVKLLVEAKGAPDRAAAETTTIAVCHRAEDKEVAIGTILLAPNDRGSEVRCALLRVAARVPTTKSLAALRLALQDSDPAVKDTAVRGLADWPDAAAIPELREVARSAEKKTHQVLALRALVRMAKMPPQPSAKESAYLLAEVMTLARRPEDKKLVLAALAEVHHPAALELAVNSLGEKDLEVEAANTVARIAKAIRTSNSPAAEAAVRKVLAICKSPEARQAVEGTFLFLGDLVNIAPEGKATSPDDLEKDGTAHGDQAAIDGDPATYWDEVDNQKLYRLLVTFKRPERIAAISVSGYAQHSYAPKDFEILCDGKPVKQVKNAQYVDNFLAIRLDEVTCTTVELKITGYYGRSPAVRELGIYRAAAKK